MRTLNVRFVVILSVITLVFGVGVYLLHGYQAKRNADFFLELAKDAKKRVEAAKEAGDKEEEKKAIDDQLASLDWYLKLRPDELDVLEEWGMLLAENIRNSRTLNQAHRALEEVLRKDSTREKVREKLIELSMYIRRYSDAQEHLKYFLGKHPDDPKYLDLLGQCQQRSGEETNAVTTYEKAIQFGPKQIDTYARLALLLRSQRRDKEADKWMGQLVEVNPEDAKAHMRRAEYLLAMGKRDEATEHALKALELAPDDLEALLLATHCALRNENFDEARKHAQRGIELSKDDARFYSSLAEVEIRSQQYDKALEILDQGLKVTKDNRNLLWAKANFLIRTRGYDAAEKTTRELGKLPNTKGRVEYLLAQIHFAQGHWLEACRGFERARPELTMLPGLLKQVDFFLGVCYGRLKNLDQQLAAFRRALAADPSYEPARRELIAALEGAGRYNTAAQEIETILKTSENPARYLLSQIRIKIRQNFRRPKQKRNWGEVQKMLEKAAQATPDSVEVIRYQCEVFAAQKKYAEAEKLLRKELEKQPANLRLWNTRVVLSLHMQNWDKAEEILALWEREIGDSVELRLAKAQLAIRRYGEKAGPHLQKLEENRTSFNERESLALVGGLMNAARRINDQENLLRLATLVAEKDPRNLQVHFIRMDQAYRKRDQAAVEKAVKDIEKFEGRGPLWLYGQALILEIRHRKTKDKNLLTQALKQLKKAAEVRRSWPRIPLMMGAIYDELGDPKRALQKYMEAINLGSYNPVAVRRAVWILYSQQRYMEADQLLQTMEFAQAPITPETVRVWSEVLLLQGDVELAVEKARQAVAARGEDYRQYLWLGQVLGAATGKARNEGRRPDATKLAKEAEKAYRQAIQLNDAAPESWMNLVGFLCKQDRNTEAEAVLNQAREKLDGITANMVLAHGYEALEQDEKAKDYYEAALAAEPDNVAVLRSVVEFYQRTGRIVQAEAQLKRVLKGKLKVEDDDMRWARRNMAIIVASRGGYANLQKARKMIKQNLKNAPRSVPDLRWSAIIDISDPSPKQRDEGILTLTRMIENNLAFPKDLFVLIRQYLNRDDWNNASKLFPKLVTIAGNEPRYLAAYVRALIDHHEVSNAAGYLNRLNQIAPNRMETVQLRAEMLSHRGKHSEALELLKSFPDQPDAIPFDRSRRIYGMAVTMERLADQLKGTDQQVMADKYLRFAELYFRQYVDDHPSQAVVLMEFMVRQGQREEALRILERLWRDCDPISMAKACMKISEDGKGTRQIVSRVERVLLQAQARFKNHPAIFLTLGDMCVGQSRFDEAEEIYRGVLKKNAGHSIAMNNLAVLLSATKKNPDEALQLINKAMEVAGPLASMLDTRACVYLARRQTQKAIKDLDSALENSRTPVRLFHLAVAKEQAGHKNAATDAMQEALKMGLTENMVLTLEVPTFQRLEEATKAFSAP